MSKRVMWGLFLPLYGSQFLAIGFLFTALAAIARERGGDLEDIGIIYAVGFIWALKFLWAPLVDKYGSRKRGHYRSWLVVTQPAAALGILALTPMDVGSQLPLILIILTVVAILSATQDIATDALAVRLMHGKGRGGVNGVQIGANFIGDVVGGGAVLVMYEWLGWVPAIITLAAVVSIPVFFIQKFKEPVIAPVEPKAKPKRPTMRSLFRQPGMKRWLLVLTPLLAIGMPGAYGMLVPLLIDSGVSVGMVGLLTNGVGGIIGIAGALAAGAYVHKLGRRRALIWYGVGQSIAIASMIPVAAGLGMAWVWLALVLLNIFNSAIFVIMYTINMDNSRKESAGSDFTMQTSISLGLRFAAGGGVIAIAGSAGYTMAMVACTVVSLVALVAVVALYRQPEPVEVPERELAPAPAPQAAVQAA